MQQEDQRKEIVADNWTLDSLKFGARENLTGFFDLLLQIDQRNNPELYARHSDTDNS